MTKEFFNPEELKQFCQLKADLNTQGLSSEELVIVINSWQTEKRVYLETYSLAQAGLNHPINFDHPEDQAMLHLAWRAQDENNFRSFNENEIIILSHMACRQGEQRNKLQDDITQIGDLAGSVVKQIPYAKFVSNFFGLWSDEKPQFQGLTRDYLERFDPEVLNNSLQGLISSRDVSFSPGGFQHVFGSWLNQQNVSAEQQSEYLRQFQQLTNERLGGVRAELSELTVEQRQIRKKVEGLIQLLDQTKEVRELLKAYGLEQQKMNIDTQLKLNALIQCFQKAEQVRMIQEEKEKFLQRFEDAKAVFTGIGQLGRQIGNRNLELMGSIGNHGIAIANEFSKFAGLIPGMVAPTGIGLLLCGANLSIATASFLLSLLHRHKKSPSQFAQIQQSLEYISRQIEALRQEMRDRFDRVDWKLQEICQKMIDGFTRIEVILTDEINLLQDMIKTGHRNIVGDIEHLKRLNETLHLSNVLDRFDLLSNRIDNHIQGDNVQENQFIKDLIDYEFFLKETFCDNRFNGGIHFETEKKNPDRQTPRFLSEMQDKDVSLILGYLARYARDQVKIHEIQEVHLPRLERWSAGVEQALIARSCLKQRHHKDSSLQDLKAIKAKALSGIEFVDRMAASIPQIFGHFITDYQQGAKDFEEIAIEELVNQLNTELKLHTKWEQIPLAVIKPVIEQKDFPNLEFKHFSDHIQTKNFSIPASLICAQQLGLGHWEAFYQASIRYGSYNLDDSGHYHYHYRVNPGIVKGEVNLNFVMDENKKVIQIISANFQKQIGSSWSDKSQGKHHKQRKEHTEQLTPKYERLRDEQKSLSPKNLPEYFKGNIIEVKLETKVNEHPEVKQFVSILWNNAKKNDNSHKRILDLKSSIKFESALIQMQTARDLALLYGKLLGFTSELMKKISDLFEVNLDHLLNNPSLFSRTSEINEFPSQITDSYQSEKLKSSVRQRFEHILARIELFEHYVLGFGHIFDPDSIANQEINGTYIPWSQISKDEEIKNGEGGFGVVYRGIFVHNKQPIAIKEMKIGDQESFGQEVALCRNLKSKYIIQIYGYSQCKGKHYLIMELAERSLSDLIHNKESQISEPQKIRMALGIAKGLAHLHQNRIVHGDIKSYNILLDEALNTKIADFGLAKEKIETSRATITGKTTSSKLQYSLLWQAPEALRDKLYQPNFKSDVYSFGVVLWEIFSRKLPFCDKSIPQILQAVQGNSRSEEEKIPENLPRVFEEVIQDCWKDSMERPSMQEIVQKLEQAFPEICKILDENAPQVTLSTLQTISFFGASRISSLLPTESIGPKLNASQFKEFKYEHQSEVKLIDRIRTKGGGDCALHAILGEWDQSEHQLVCADIKGKRDQVRAAIVNKDNKEPLLGLIITGIQELVMSGRNIGESSQALLNNYRRFLSDQKDFTSGLWPRFEAVLRQHPLVMEYIQKKHHLPEGSSLRDQFYDALNQNEGELYGRMLSLPALHEAFRDYSQLQNIEFDWDSAISAQVKEEYADFVGTAHAWLLPSELAIIAKVFHVSVIYYPNPGALPLILNPGEQSTVAVQFNGSNHFERLQLNNDVTVVMLPGNQVPKKDLSPSPLSASSSYSPGFIAPPSPRRRPSKTGVSSELSILKPF